MLLILNDIGTSELVLILVFILIFFGSKSIPGIARTMGRTLRQVRNASDEIQTEIKKSGREMKGDLNIKEIIEDTTRDVKQPLDQYAADMEDALELKPKTSRPRRVLSQQKPEESTLNQPTEESPEESPEGTEEKD